MNSLPLYINQYKINAQVDSGATTSFIPLNLLKEVESNASGKLEIKEVDDDIYATLGDGSSKVKVIGKVTIPIGDAMVDTMVIESKRKEMLIGKDFLGSMGIDVNKLVWDKLQDKTKTRDVNTYSLVQKDSSSGSWKDGLLLGAMFDEEISIPEPGQFTHLKLTESDRLLLKEFLEVDLPLALAKRCKGEPIKVTPRVIRLDIDASPISGQLRQYSPIQEKYLEEWTAELLKLGFIVECNDSPWSHPVHVVMDENGKYRMVTDLRKLNERVHLVRYPLPNLQTIQAKIKGMRWFAKLDACKGYFQVPISEDSQEFFAFTSHNNKFKPTRLPQGFKNSVSIYQQVMMEILGEELLMDNVMVLLDDILLFGETVEQLITLLKKVVNRLSEKNLLINYKKSVWISDSITWCGRKLSANGVGFDEKQINNFIQMDYPDNGDKLQKFLCGINFFRNSILDYSRISKPLYDELLRLNKITGSKKSKTLAKQLTDKNDHKYPEILQKNYQSNMKGSSIL